MWRNLSVLSIIVCLTATSVARADPKETVSSPKSAKKCQLFLSTAMTVYIGVAMAMGTGFYVYHQTDGYVMSRKMIEANEKGYVTWNLYDKGYTNEAEIEALLGPSHERDYGELATLDVSKLPESDPDHMQAIEKFDPSKDKLEDLVEGKRFPFMETSSEKEIAAEAKPYRDSLSKLPAELREQLVQAKINKVILIYSFLSGLSNSTYHNNDPHTLVLALASNGMIIKSRGPVIALEGASGTVFSSQWIYAAGRIYPDKRAYLAPMVYAEKEMASAFGPWIFRR